MDIMVVKTNKLGFFLAIVLLTSMLFSGNSTNAANLSRKVVTSNTTTIDGDFTGQSTSNNSGGALNINGTYTVGTVNSNFEQNSVNKSGDAYGGAIYNNNGKITTINGKFKNNFATGTSTTQGGAIFTQNGNITKIENSLFENNTAQGTNWVEGGAIWMKSGEIGSITANFINNSITATSGTVQGGAIYLNGGTNIGIIDGKFSNNTATTNSGKGSGGAIYNSGGTISEIKNSGFHNNKVTTTGDALGGAIYNANGGNITSIITLDGFTNNSVKSSSGNAWVEGGAIWNSNNGKIGTIVGDFINNNAIGNTAQGGAIYNNESGSRIESITGNFEGNYVEGTTAKGGAILNNTSAYIGNINGNFKNNYAQGTNDAHGGAIYTVSTIGGKDANDNILGGINNATFDSNYAKSDYTEAKGGAIYKSNGTISIIDNAEFKNNQAIGNTTTAGGAIYQINGSIGDINADFTNNKTSSTRGQSLGGAIYTDYANIGTINGKFKNNSSASGESFNVQGGAIFKKGGKITKIDNSEFLNNTITSIGNVSGGAIYQNGGEIGDISANFQENKGTSTDGSANGGAIYNENAKIGTISGKFNNNSTKTVNGTAQGGAIYNNSSSTVTAIINSEFSNNKAEGKDWVEGGAIWNSNYSTIGDITANFTNNSAITTANTAQGGAIYNNWDSKIGTIKGDFINNSVTGTNANGGAIMNNSSATIGDVYGNFVNNSVKSENSAAGGAIYNISTIGTKDASNKLTGGLINSSLIGNSVISQNGTAKGGAIYTTKDLNYIIDNNTIEIKDNYTQSGSTVDDNAIYLDSSNAKLTINIKNNGKLILSDNISGLSGSKVEITGDNTGVLNLYNDINNNVTLNNITIDNINNSIDINKFNSLTLNSDIDYNADVNLSTGEMDRFTAGSYGTHNGILNVANLNYISMDTNRGLTEIFFAEQGLKDNVVFSGESSIITPIYKYNIAYDNREDAGYFLFGKGNHTFIKNANGSVTTLVGKEYEAFNPSVLTGPTNAIAGALGTMNQTLNFAFNSVDTFMNLTYEERLLIRNKNKYALSPANENLNMGRFSPLYLYADEEPGFWVKPYASFENIPLKNGPKVDNITYGTIIGYDTEMTSIKNGWDRVLTGYVGYNGSNQNFLGVDTTQNGGLFGGTITLYKGNLFNATTLNVGTTTANNRTMYGSDNLTMLTSGLANKTGYNLELFKGKFIFQPNFLMAYSFVNTFDYRNAAGVNIKSDPLHAIQIAPGLKFIGNLKNGWQPYASVNMVWNLMCDNDTRVDGIKLPEMNIKPYIQYGVGVQKRIKDHFTAYGQAMILNGGRNGISLSAGLKWLVGKKK